MKTVTVTLKKEHALRLLEDLEQLEILSIDAAIETASLTDNKAASSAERTFNAFSFPTKGWKFDRDEANER